MRTTTHVFQFVAEASQEALSAKQAVYNASGPKIIMIDFFNLHGISDDNLVSENADNETCLRTVVRNWPSLEIATAWTVELTESNAWRNANEFPGMVISAVVDPE